MKVYKVGGFVRDTLLGLDPKDIDYVVVGSSPEEMLSKGFAPVGEDFPVFLHPETKDEYALARTERKVGHGYHGFETYFSSDVTLEEDLMRRDLTVNSMAMDDDGNVIDPFNGQEDLKNRILRHTSVAFKEDPVRALRIARFKARYDFEVADDTIELIKEMKANGEFQHLKSERVLEELKKGMKENDPGIMLSFIREHEICDWLRFTNRTFDIALEDLKTAKMFSFNETEKLMIFFYNSFLTKEDMIEFTFPKVVFDTIQKMRNVRKNLDASPSDILDSLKFSGMLNASKSFSNVFNVLKIVTRDPVFVNDLERVINAVNAVKFKDMQGEFKGLSGQEINKIVRQKHINAIESML